MTLSLIHICAWAQQAYGIPPEQVIGTTFVTTYDVRDGKPTLWRTAKLEFNDDGPGKPVAIQRHIGKRPILAFGNSDGDLQMLQWLSLIHIYQLAARRSLDTLPSAKLKIGRSLSSSVSLKSQPTPPVAEMLFQRVGMRRVCAPCVATKVGS